MKGANHNIFVWELTIFITKWKHASRTSLAYVAREVTSLFPAGLAAPGIPFT